MKLSLMEGESGTLAEGAKPKTHGEARVLETDGDRAVLQSSRPFPAGATLVGTDVAGAEYRVKVRGGRRIDEHWFRIEGRFVSLTKSQREQLLARMTEGSGS